MGFKVWDYFAQKAKGERYLARSVYKLQEIDRRFHLIKKGERVLDLGYYPGSWIQYTSSVIGPRGLVLGVDLQPLKGALIPLGNVRLVQGDINRLSTLSDLGEGQPFRGVLSDMAPRTTGIKAVDQARSLALGERVLELLPECLERGGYLVVKLFDSQEAQGLVAQVKGSFNTMHRVRPRSTRSVSKEFFVIGKGFCI